MKIALQLIYMKNNQSRTTKELIHTNQLDLTSGTL